MPEAYYSVRTFAQELRIPEADVRRRLEAGWPCVRRFGGFETTVMFARHHVQDWRSLLEAERTPAETPIHGTRKLDV